MLEAETDVVPQVGDATPPTPPPIESTEPASPPPRKSIRDHLKEEFAKHRVDEEAQSRRAEAAKARARHADGTFAADSKPVEAPKESAPGTPLEVKPDVQPDAAQQASGPPPGWTATAKTKWSSLPPDIQESVLKREKEVSDGFKAKSDELKALQERSKEGEATVSAFKPYEQEIKSAGRTYPEVVAQLMGWFKAISHPNVAMRTDAARLLLRSFNIDLNQEAAPRQPNPQPTETAPPEMPAELRPLFEAIDHRLNERLTPFQQHLVAQQQAIEQQQAAYVHSDIQSWAQDKPHFEKVRVHMGQLVNAGMVPFLPNGKPNLDEAYRMAVGLNAEVQAEIQKAAEEERAKKDAEAKIAAEKAAADQKVAAEKKAAEEAAEAAKAARLAQQRKASVSVRSSSPTQPPQERAQKKMSIRESIQAAFREHSTA
jgi:hypothetical protein